MFKSRNRQVIVGFRFVRKADMVLFEREQEMAIMPQLTLAAFARHLPAFAIAAALGSMLRSFSSAATQ